ncbi:MAG: RNA methyltransferase [Bacteroidota bacterium]
MLSRNTIKYIQSLQQKKFRQMYNNFIVEGTKMTAEILRHAPFEVESIYALGAWIDQNQPILTSFQTITHEVSPKELDRISGLKTPNQVLLVCKQPAQTLDLSTINHSLTLYLDELQNPGNMGSILRIADWFGIPYVFCSPESVEQYNPKVIQASMGAFLRVKVVSMSFDQLVEKVPDLPILAAVLEGESVFSTTASAKGVLVIGNEGKGISESIVQQATHLVSIPKAGNGGAESLYAAVATGILCGVLLGGGGGNG